MDPAWLLSALLCMLLVKMSFSTKLDSILLNVEALNSRGVLNLKPRSDLVAFPPGLVDVRETAAVFSQAQTRFVLSQRQLAFLRAQEGEVKVVTQHIFWRPISYTASLGLS